MYKIQKVLTAVMVFSFLGCVSMERKKEVLAATLEQQSKSQQSQTAGAKKMAAWLTGNSRVLYQNSNYTILGLEYTSLTKPTDTILLDVIGLENKMKNTAMQPLFFSFKIGVKDAGGKKISIPSFSFFRGGKHKIHMEHTPCILVYSDNAAQCEIGVKITGEEIAPESIEVYTLVAKASGFDTDDDAINIEMKKYQFDTKHQEEKVYVLYSPNWE